MIPACAHSTTVCSRPARVRDNVDAAPIWMRMSFMSTFAQDSFFAPNFDLPNDGRGLVAEVLAAIQNQYDGVEIELLVRLLLCREPHGRGRRVLAQGQPRTRCRGA